MDVPHYNMNHKKRGMALILNHHKFSISGCMTRAGTKADGRRLKAVLKTYGFDVMVLIDKRFKRINEELERIAKIDHSDHDCLLIAVLTHGELGKLYAKDTHYSPDFLWERFTDEKCPSLAGKPKIFIIQACQGELLDDGVILTDNHVHIDDSGSDDERENPEETSWFASYINPPQADFLVVNSTVPKLLSWRNDIYGAWFVESLCDELERADSDQHNILTLLNNVNRDVALNYESIKHNYKQASCFTSMLTKIIVLTKKN